MVAKCANGGYKNPVCLRAGPLPKIRVSDKGNSGINYRSLQVPDPDTKWAMQGYQADIDGQDQWSGQNYEERGRTFLAYRGESVILKPGQKPEVTKQLGDRAEAHLRVLVIERVKR